MPSRMPPAGRQRGIAGRADLVSGPLFAYVRTAGPAISPYNAWTCLKGMETLGVRMERHMANTASILNGLIETSKDGEKGFRTSADHAKSPELKALYQKRAEDCARGASVLQSIVAQLGE